MKARERLALALPPEMPWSIAGRLTCLALAVERRSAGQSPSEIMTAAEEFWNWASAPPKPGN